MGTIASPDKILLTCRGAMQLGGRGVSGLLKRVPQLSRTYGHLVQYPVQIRVRVWGLRYISYIIKEEFEGLGCRFRV